MGDSIFLPHKYLPHSGALFCCQHRCKQLGLGCLAFGVLHSAFEHCELYFLCAGYELQKLQ